VEQILSGVVILFCALTLLLSCCKKRCPVCARPFAVVNDGEWDGLAMWHCEKCGAAFEERY